MAVNPTIADQERFMAEDPGTPVVMLNLLRFAEGGRESYGEYLRRFAQIFPERYGVEIVYAGGGSTVLAAEPGQEWDAVVLVRYPSRETFMRMVGDPDYVAIAHLRSLALTETVLQATTAVTDFDDRWAFTNKHHQP